MRIAFITFEYPPFINGGAGIYALNVTQELSELGHNVVVFTPDIFDENLMSKFDNLEIQKVPVNRELPFKALQFWLRLPKEIKKAERKQRFDIIHFNSISYWFLKKRLSKAKHILTVHHLVIDAIKNNNLSLISRIKDVGGENGVFIPFIERRCLSCADKIIAVSQFTKKQIIDYYGINYNKIEVIYNGISSSEYLFSEDEIITAKKQLTVSTAPIILFVGRIDDPRKDLAFLLKSMKKVLENMNVTLLVVGKGDRAESTKLIDSLGISDNVIFTGFVDETTLKCYYSLCDIYICPSKLEGFGLTILEAMIAGKPVIATKVGAIPEILNESINGIIVKSGNIESMSNAIITLIQEKDLAINIGRKNKEYVKNKFDWVKCAKKIENLYK
jgi:glycosyltransferase involved in cell wall biosynthesis